MNRPGVSLDVGPDCLPVTAARRPLEYGSLKWPSQEEAFHEGDAATNSTFGRMVVGSNFRAGKFFLTQNLN